MFKWIKINSSNFITFSSIFNVWIAWLDFLLSNHAILIIILVINVSFKNIIKVQSFKIIL